MFPTSNLNPIDETTYSKIYEDNRKDLELIEDLAIELLNKCRANSTVIIVTNGKRGWVEFSSSVFMPRLHELMLRYIRIISARDLYEKDYPQDGYIWKELAFLDLWDEPDLLDTAAITNLIAMGDSDYEMEAARRFSAKSDRCLMKLIKLGEMPSFEELRKELVAVVDRFDYIFSSFKNLTVRLERVRKD